jgi:hypothetical protein
MATHDCPITGCNVSVPYSMLMCPGREPNEMFAI